MPDIFSCPWQRTSHKYTAHLHTAYLQSCLACSSIPMGMHWHCTWCQLAFVITNSHTIFMTVNQQIVLSTPHRRSQEFVLEGLTTEAPKAPRLRRRRRWGGREWGVGVLLPSRLAGLWERCKLPQRGPGQSPGRKRVEYLELEKNTPDSHKPVIFDISAAFSESHSHSQLLNMRLSHNICSFCTTKTVVQIFSTPFGGLGPPGPPLVTPMPLRYIVVVSLDLWGILHNVLFQLRKFRKVSKSENDTWKLFKVSKSPVADSISQSINQSSKPNELGRGTPHPHSPPLDAFASRFGPACYLAPQYKFLAMVRDYFTRYTPLSKNLTTKQFSLTIE